MNWLTSTAGCMFSGYKMIILDFFGSHSWFSLSFFLSCTPEVWIILWQTCSSSGWTKCWTLMTRNGRLIYLTLSRWSEVSMRWDKIRWTWLQCDVMNNLTYKVHPSDNISSFPLIYNLFRSLVQWRLINYQPRSIDWYFSNRYKFVYRSLYSL